MVFGLLSLIVNHHNLIIFFILNMHTNDLLIYIMPTKYDMIPYSCFREEMSVDVPGMIIKEINNSFRKQLPKWP